MAAKCIIVQAQPPNGLDYRFFSSCRHMVPSPRNSKLSPRSAAIVRLAIDAKNLSSDVTPSFVNGKYHAVMPLEALVTKPGLFYDSILGRRLSDFVGIARLLTLVENCRILVPLELLKLARSSYFESLLQGGATTADLLPMLRCYFKLITATPRVKRETSGGATGGKCTLYIHCSGKGLHFHNQGSGTWSNIKISRQLFLFCDGFNRKFGLGTKGLIGSVLKCMDTHDVHALAWKLAHFVLFSNGLVSLDYKQRQNSITAFIASLDSPELKRPKSRVLQRLTGLFARMLCALKQLDWKLLYGRHVFTRPDFNGGHVNAVHFDCVYNFLAGIFSAVVPLELLGGHANMQRLLQVVDTLVRLNKGETLSMSQVMSGVGICHLQWSSRPVTGVAATFASNGATASAGYCSASQTRYYRECLCRIYFLLLEHLLVPIIRRHFYVTESNYTRLRLFYFLKIKWHWMEARANAKFIAEADTSDSTFGRQKGNRRVIKTLGTSLKVRWLPKVNDLRPIVNCNVRGTARPLVKMLQSSHKNCSKSRTSCLVCCMQHLSKSTPCRNESLNRVLELPKVALGYNCRLNPGLLGCGILGSCDAYKALLKWWKRLIHWRPLASDLRLYVLVADLKRCFESIPRDEIERVISQVPLINLQCRRTSKSCLVGVASSVNCFYKSFYLAGPKVNGNGVCSKRRMLKLQHTQLLQCASSVFLSKYNSEGDSIGICSNDVLRATRALLQCYSVALPKCRKRLLVKGNNGIPQGCCMSTLLCSLYMANRDACAPIVKLLQGPEPNLLLRLVDNFLFITPSAHCAGEFAKVMNSSGIYGKGVDVESAVLDGCGGQSPAWINIRFSLEASSSEGVALNPNKPSAASRTFQRIKGSASEPRDPQNTFTSTKLASSYPRWKLNACMVPFPGSSELVLRDSIALKNSKGTTFMFGTLEQRLTGYLKSRLGNKLFSCCILNTPKSIITNAYIATKLSLLKLDLASRELVARFGMFVNARYYNRLVRVLINTSITLVSRGGLDVKVYALDQILYAAANLVYRLPRPLAKLSAANAMLVEEIEAKFANQWPV